MKILLAPLLYLLAHEGGHFLAALFLGCKPKITAQSWHIVVSYTYDKQWKRRLISEMGFGAGLMAGLAVMFAFGRIEAFAYWCAFTLHFLIYPWTALDTANDFDGMCSHSKED
jgi:hypothetical protein